MPEDLNLHTIANKKDYKDKINNWASAAVTKIVNEELDYRNHNTLRNYIESQKSFHHAVEQLDKEWSDYSTLDVAAVYDIIKENYEQTLQHIQRKDLFDSPNPETNFRDLVLNCMAYDLAKTIDFKLDNVISDDESTKMVKL